MIVFILMSTNKETKFRTVRKIFTSNKKLKKYLEDIDAREIDNGRLQYEDDSFIYSTITMLME